MTSKSRATAEKVARMAAPAIAAAPEASAAPEVKSKTVRVSLDLTPALYDDLTAWNRKAAHQLGRTKVANADTLRSLVRLLLDRPDVAEDVIRRLSAEIRK